MPTPPRKTTGHPPGREKQLAHGAQSDQGGRPLTKPGPKPKPQVFEGPEESNQQRRYEKRYSG